MAYRKLPLIELSIILIALGCQRIQGASQPVKQCTNATIADELLAYELGRESDPGFKARLDEVIASAAARFGDAHQGETEVQEAARFFHAVDSTLVDHNFIFPPNGLIDLLRNALTLRTLSAQEYRAATNLFANERRLQQMEQNFQSGRKFYIADCDLSAIIYKAVGERLGLPVAFVGVSKHNFVRWSSPTLRTNWDTNDGTNYSDKEYAKRWGVTKVGRKYLGWLADMPRADIQSYWWAMIGHWHTRHGRYREALDSFYCAVNASPSNLESANELAWFLATCSDPQLRDGHKAETVAQRVVNAAPRANWIDTLAAAQAENGKFSAAVVTELRAKKAAQTVEFGISANDEVAAFDECITAYRRNLSYRQAVDKGLVKDPKEWLPYDD